jgi:hypothetical protein
MLCQGFGRWRSCGCTASIRLPTATERAALPVGSASGVAARGRCATEYGVLNLSAPRVVVALTFSQLFRFDSGRRPDQADEQAARPKRPRTGGVTPNNALPELVSAQPATGRAAEL